MERTVESASETAETKPRSRGAIEVDLAAAREALEDVEEERMMTLGGTGVHISAGRVETMRRQFEKEAADHTARITELESELARAGD